jgi:hypothetical protein
LPDEECPGATFDRKRVAVNGFLVAASNIGDRLGPVCFDIPGTADIICIRMNSPAVFRRRYRLAMTRREALRDPLRETQDDR